MMVGDTADRRLVIVSNRLPIVLAKTENGIARIEPGSGGLINALTPVLRDRGGVWIGWPGTTEEDAVDVEPLLAEAACDSGYILAPVELTATERDRFYLGFSNEIIWPLFHDLQSRCNFDPCYWATYEAVNHKFARAIAETAHSGDDVWVHDYHLMNVAKELRAMDIGLPIGFFLHIPFPAPDIFLKLPWRTQILEALLAYDLIGLQTPRDQHNLAQCLRTLLPEVTLRDDGQMVTARTDDRVVRIASFPIGIDFQAFARQAASAEVKQRVQHIRGRLPGLKLMLGVDRLDYTKGIPQRLEAFRNALLRFPELREQVVLTQVVVPSRTDIREYHELKVTVERLVSEINGQFTQAGWVPIHYINRSLEWNQLLAYYRTADIALLTPLKDGMNLVAKEYCACSLEDGVLILSEFAGAAPQLQPDALLVNPNDVEGVADTIAHAWAMHPEQRRIRMQNLRRSIREQDVFWWVDTFLHAQRASHDASDRLPENDGLMGTTTIHAPNMLACTYR
jgi:trehalose 6-phosphate synthase